jgi:hypothetical protein
MSVNTKKKKKKPRKFKEETDARINLAEKKKNNSDQRMAGISIMHILITAYLALAFCRRSGHICYAHADVISRVDCTTKQACKSPKKRNYRSKTRHQDAKQAKS